MFDTFESFESAVSGYQAFLKDNEWPSELRWLCRSRVRYQRNALYVFRPLELSDASAHKERFLAALSQNKNIALRCHSIYKSFSFVAAETLSLDPPFENLKDSGSHNYQLLENPVPLIPVDSPARWLVTKLLHRNSNEAWSSLGWPA